MKDFTKGNMNALTKFSFFGLLAFYFVVAGSVPVPSELNDSTFWLGADQFPHLGNPESPDGKGYYKMIAVDFQNWSSSGSAKRIYGTGLAPVKPRPPRTTSTTTTVPSSEEPSTEEPSTASTSTEEPSTSTEYYTTDWWWWYNNYAKH